MITLETIQRIWQLIEVPASNEEQVEARELEMIDTPEGHPLLTIDVQQRHHLLIPIQQQSKPLEDRRSAGIHLLSSRWGDEVRQQQYVDVVCLKPHLNHVFDLMLFDILESLLHDGNNPDRVCYKVLNHWRELIDREVGALPDKSVLIGIIGELWILREIARYNTQAVHAWVGPSGARYDFFTGITALEVKSSTQRQGRSINIHGLDQMEPPTDGGKLYVVVLKMEETPGNGESLSDMIQTLVDMGCDRYQLLLSLSKINITLDVISKCDTVRFRVLDQKVYPVDTNFPKLTNAILSNIFLADRITSVNYQIDLSVEPPHPLQENEVVTLYQRIAQEITQ